MGGRSSRGSHKQAEVKERTGRGVHCRGKGGGGYGVEAWGRESHPERHGVENSVYSEASKEQDRVPLRFGKEGGGCCIGHG